MSFFSLDKRSSMSKWRAIKLPALKEKILILECFTARFCSYRLQDFGQGAKTRKG